MTAPGKALTRLTDLAARLLSGTSGAAVQVTLLTDVQTVLAGSGLPPAAVGAATPLADSLCAVAAEQGSALVVADARADPRVAGRGPVTSGTVGAYLGVPLLHDDGTPLGGLCAFCPQPRAWSDDDVALLEVLADAVRAQLQPAPASLDQAARLLDTMALGFLDLDHEYRITYLNEEGARILGTRADDLLGTVLWEHYPTAEEGVWGEAYRRALAERRVVEVEAFSAALDAWYEVRAVPTAHGLSLYFLDVTGRHADQDRATAAATRLELLATVSAELAAAGLDTEGAVARLSRLAVPVLADWCLVSLVEGGQLRDVGHEHADPARRPLFDRYVARRLVDRRHLGAVQQARESGAPVVVPSGVTEWVLPQLGDPEAREVWLQLGLESIVVVPLVARGHLTGVLTLARHGDRPAMDADEITTATEIAARAALALDNARLYAEQRGLAEALQRSLLTTPPEPGSCEIAVRYVPAAQVAAVGGDWFDAFPSRDGATLLVIGDVTGHDTQAAAAMGQLRGLLRGIAWQGGGGPARVLADLDAAVQGLQVDTTATAVVARLEESGRLRWSNAGHPPPLVLDADGTVTVLAGAGSDLLLGFDPATPRTERAQALVPGATVLLYTDGLVERRGQDLDTGLARLTATLGGLAGLPPQELCDALLAALLPAEAEDDVAVLAVRLRG